MRFACDYIYLGAEWHVEIIADSWEEAHERIKAIKETIRLAGEIQEEIEEGGDEG